MTKQEIIAYPRLDEDSTKEELVTHLRDVHFRGREFHINGINVANKGTKVTKSELIRFHDRLHRVLDNENRTHIDTQGRENLDYWFAYDVEGVTGYKSSAPIPRFDHTHTNAVISDEVRAAADAIRDNRSPLANPLSIVERKVLTELVNNDFHALKAEMQAVAADKLNAARIDINKDWEAKTNQTAVLVAKANEMVRAHEKAQRELADKQSSEKEALLAEAKSAGISLTWDYSRQTHEADVIGRKEALAEAEKDNKRFLDRALMALEKQRLDAQRRVLVSGVTREAAALLDSIPDAKTMMIEAQEAEAEAKAIES